jgi:hypothetical protein
MRHAALTLGLGGDGGRVECEDCVLETMQGNPAFLVSMFGSHSLHMPDRLPH